VVDVDLICVGTTTPDQVFPNVACLLQQRLGIKGPPAIQVEAACAGFIYALSVADKFIRLGDAKCALVIGADTFTRLLDWSDRDTCVLFGDGAGAIVLKAAEQGGVLSTRIHANGEHADLLFYPTGPSKKFNPLVVNQAATHMRGGELFRVAVNTMGNLVHETLRANHIDSTQIDWLIPHQANLRIIQAVAKKLDIPMERVIVTVQDHGNTSAASVPLALDHAVKDGRVKPGQLVLMEAFGGGLTWGSALVRM
jgi:3-oxoacyl-[acyl-carrier-protein] synthase-3